MPRRFRINQAIRSPTIRLIDEQDKQVGIVTLEKALTLAREKELDLVEIAPQGNPPVCKILDFGKFLYRQKKIDQKHKKGQRHTEVKGVRLSLRIGPHDLEVKAEQARRFLSDRNVVKVSMILRGREMAHLNLARQKILHFADLLKETAAIEEPPKRQGNTLMLLLAPL